MITLYVLSVIYTIIALKRFKKLYGTYDILEGPAKVWTVIIPFTLCYSIVFTIVFCIKYLP